MPLLSQDIITEIARALLDSDDGRKDLMSMALVSTLCTLPAQTFLFRSITVHYPKGCPALLQVLECNPRLRTFVKRVTLRRDKHYDDPEPDEFQWHHSAPAGNLLKLLVNIETIHLSRIQIDEVEIERLIRFLDGPLQSVTELFLSDSYITGSHHWARLVLHFPYLETIRCRRTCEVNVAWNDPPPDGWITAPNSCSASSQLPGHLRRMKAGFVQSYAQGVNTSWIAQSNSTHNLEELELRHSSCELFGTLWDLARSAAHTLKMLSIPVPHPTGTYPSLDSLPMLNAPQLSYLRLYDRSNDMSLDPVIAVLEVISPSLSLRRLVLDQIRSLDHREDPHDMFRWEKLDEVVTHNFRALEEVIIDVVFFAAEDDQERHPPTLSDLRLAMPRLHASGIMQLLMVPDYWSIDWASQ